MPRLAVDLRLPAHVEPLATVGVDHGRQERHVVAPARLAAQAQAVDAVLRIMDLGDDVGHLGPGRGWRHRQAGSLDQVGPVHRHRAFAIERCRVQLAFMRQAAADGWQQVVDVIGRVGHDRLEPALLGPDRCFVKADRHHIELAALGGDVGGHALAQRAFFQRHPLELGAGVGGFKFLGVLLHFDHVAVVHGGNDQVGGLGQTGRGQCGHQAGFEKKLHGGLLRCKRSATLRITVQDSEDPGA